MKKVFVGTLRCGENDYGACLEALTGQRNVDIKHHVISDMPEKEAHNALWSAWHEAREAGYELFVKVDADTVLAHPDVLKTIVESFESNPRLTGMQCPLHDYFTDSLINGLNCYDHRVKFSVSTNVIYPDRQDHGHIEVYKADRVPVNLRPAGYHCHYANEVQAFHYGLHRGLKSQNDIREKVIAAYKVHNDKLRWFALQGFDERICSQFRKDAKFNYADPEFIEAFQLVQEGAARIWD